MYYRSRINLALGCFFIAALTEVVQAFMKPENLTKMNAAREQAGNDILKMMQIVLPVATQIQQEVIEKYGFSSDQQGTFMLMPLPF